MASATELLRLLEPLIRPGGAAGQSQAPRLPLEQESFENLLAQVRDGEQAPQAAAPAGDEAQEQQASSARPDPLGPLARVDAIENPSLRALVARGNNQ